MKKGKNVPVETIENRLNELKPMFEKSLLDFHKVGRGANRRISQLLPNAEMEDLDFFIYERQVSDDPLEGVKNVLIEKCDFTNYILSLSNVPKWARSLALSGLSMLPEGVVVKASKDLYTLFKESGYTSATIFYNEGVVKTIVRMEDGTTQEVDLFSTLDAYLSASLAA